MSLNIVSQKDLNKERQEKEGQVELLQVDSAEYQEKVKLAKDWIDKTGIPLVYASKEVSNLMMAYNSLSIDMQNYSDQKSKELFNLNNTQHFTMITNYSGFVEREDTGEREENLEESFFFNKRYVNFDKKVYAKDVEKTLDDKYMYIVFSYSSGTFSSLIRSVTNDPFSHVSLSFDSKFSTLVSFLVQSKMKVAKNKFGNTEGLVRENPLLTYDTNTKFEMYKVKVSKSGKKDILAFIMDILDKGSNYNKILLLRSMLLGRHFERREDQPYSLVCSQFVVMALNAGGVNLLDKAPEFVRPYDILKMSKKSQLKFHSEGYIFDAYIDRNKEILPNNFSYERPENPMKIDIRDWINKQKLVLKPI